MIKIQDDNGKTLYTVKDDATEPVQVYSICSAHQKPDPTCRLCNVQPLKGDEK